MTQKSFDNSPVTKKELKEILKSYPSKKYLKENYPTKDDLSERLNDSFEAFRQETNYNFQMMMDRMDEKFSKFTNQILLAIDPLLKELETRQQDREIATAEMRGVKTEITNLKKRVTKLEHS